MTKDQAVTFLTEAGNITMVEEVDEACAFVKFKHLGTALVVQTYEDDEAYLVLRCAYRLRNPVADELSAYRVLAKLQNNYKVAKLSLEDEWVVAAAEQFVAGEEVDSIFWRTVGLISEVAYRASRELAALDSTARKARQAIERLEHGFSEHDATGVEKAR